MILMVMIENGGERIAILSMCSYLSSTTQALLPFLPQAFHLPPTPPSQLLPSVFPLALHRRRDHVLSAGAVRAAAPFPRSPTVARCVEFLVRAEGYPHRRAGSLVGAYRVPRRAQPAGEVKGERHEAVQDERKGHDGGGADAWVRHVHGLSLCVGRRRVRGRP